MTATATAGDTLTAGDSNTFDVVKKAASITDPVMDGDRLTGATFTFKWDSGAGVDQYRLWVGTTLGGKDIYNQSTGLTQQATVTGLATDGSAVYVQLNSYIDGAWQSTQNQYLAAQVGVATNITFNTIAQQTAGAGFAVRVNAVDAASTPIAVTADTRVALSVFTGTGTLGGTTAGTIPNGSSSFTISNVTYDKAESGVVLRATRVSGDALTSGDSNAFNVVGGAANKLSVVTIADQGQNVAFSVTVNVLDASNNPATVSLNTTITLSKKSGSSPTGTAGGVLTADIPPSGGSVTISGVTWDTAETGILLTATATAGDSLTAADSNAFNVRQYTEGTLILDFIDPGSDQLVWRGWYSDAVGEGEISEKKINTAVKHILEKFPPQTIAGNSETTKAVG